MASTYNLKDECGVSAFSLALSVVVDNPELASKIADLAEQAAEAGLRSDALKEGALQGIEGDIKTIAHEYSLKEQSADMKFKAVVFGGLFDKTAQGDEALRIIGDEILETGGTVAEGIELFNLIDSMSVSSLEDVARIMANGDIESAKKMVDDIRSKLSYYIGTNYSVVTTGDPVKLNAIIKRYEDRIAAAQKKIDDALQKTGGKQLRHIEGDLKKVNELKANTIEGKNALLKIGKEYGITDPKRIKEKLTKKLNDLKKAKDTLEEARKEKKALKAAQEYKEALAGDMKLIKDGLNPYNLIEGSDEWKFIKGFDADPTGRAKKYGQYVLARTLLTGGKDLPQEVINVIKEGIIGGVTNYLDENLTEDWILSEDRTLEELMARAFTNTADLANNGQLRTVWRQRLMALASAGELATKDVQYIETLMNVMSFSGVGAGFSDILKYEYLVRAANNLGLKVPDSQGDTLWKSIVNLFKKDQKTFQRSIAGDFVKLGNGIELTNRQLLELVSSMLGSININRLIASDTATDRELLDVVGKYLIGDRAGGNRLVELITAAKNAPTTDDVRGVVLKTITGKNVPKDAKVGFFDFRRDLKADASVDARAKFMDRLSGANVLELPNNTIEDVTDSIASRIAEFKGGFILVNDSQWKMNKALCDAIDSINLDKATKPEERITVIYPSSGLMGTIKSEGGRLLYRTVDTNKFDTLVRNISIRTLGQTDVDSRFSKELQQKLIGGDVDAIAEYNKLVEEDAMRYFGEMLGVGPEAYKEKLPGMLEQATGISFKNYDAIVDKVAFWRKIDENFIISMKTGGNMTQEFVTVGDVVKEVDALTPEQMAGRLSDMFGLEISADGISDNGVVRQGIKEAYLSYQLSQTPIELLERKGRLLAVLNGGTADNITISQFKAMMQSGNFNAYKEIFFHNLNMTDEELEKHAKKINDMVFNSLCSQLAMNLVQMGYSLPLVNIRDLVYDYLMDRLNVNGDFARAFLYKNGLADTLETLRGIVNEAMPSELRFGYDDGFQRGTGNYYNSIGVWQESHVDQRYGYIDVLSDGTLFRNGYRWWGNTANWIDVLDSTVAVNAPSAVNGMTVGQLANAYGIPLFIAADSYLDNIGAWGVLGRTYLTGARLNGREFVQSMINLRSQIPAGTASHELFHAVFLTMAPEDTKYFIDTAMKLYNYDERVANEMLADLFSEYFRTGSFSLPKHKASFRKVAEEQNFISWITRFFGRMAAWLGLVDNYEKEIGKLFDDILSGNVKTTKSKFSKAELQSWNDRFVKGWRNSYLPPKENYAAAQAKMIMLIDENIGSVINGQMTFEALQEKLGKEIPGLKPFFDKIKKGDIDLQNRTINGLSYAERRNVYFSENGYGQLDGSVNVDDIINQFITTTREEFSDNRYKFLINTLLESNNNDLLKEVVRYAITNKKNKELLYDLYSALNLEREYYLAKKDAGELVGFSETSFPNSPYNTLTSLLRDIENTIGRRPTIRKKVSDKVIYKEIQGLKGQNFNKVLDKITGNGYGIPIEIGVVVDDNGKIVSIGSGGPDAINTKEAPAGYTLYHSHPELGWFSGNLDTASEGGDLISFVWEIGKYENEGLINPGGVVLTFKNDGTFRRAADTTVNPLLQAILGIEPEMRNRWGTIQSGLITSLITGEYDRQIRGVFTPIVERYKDDVEKIVNKYDFHELVIGGETISAEDKLKLADIGARIEDEVKQDALYYITHGPYQDRGPVLRGIGDMFNYSNKVDSQGRYLTNGQEAFGFATVGDVQQLDSGIKFEGSQDDDIVRAYFSNRNVSGASLGYDIFFEPIENTSRVKVPSTSYPTNISVNADACYIRFNPDNIVDSSDRLFSIVDREDMLDRLGNWVIYNPGMYKALKNVDENITIKEFINLLEDSGYYRAGDGVREMFFDIIDGYYDEAEKRLHLFDYSDVKHINNLNPKEVPNVYFQNGYGPTGGFVREFTDPATGIGYKLTPDDFVNIRGEWRLKTEFVPIEELDKLKEFDRRTTPKFSDSDDIINDLKEKFKKEGIQNPLYIHYSLADGKAYLAEGNHRLAAAKELGMKYLPVWVDVSKKVPSGKGVKVAKPNPFGPGDFYPDTMAPSDIGIKGVINPFNNRGYYSPGKTVSEATYNRGEVDSTGRAISDQQDDFFEESKFRDENGNLLVLYRGALDTYPVGAMKSDRYYEGIIFMTPDKRVARAYSMWSDWDELGGQIESISQANEYIRNLVPNRNVEFVKKGDKIQLTLDGESLKEFSSLKEITNYLKKGEGNSDVTILVKDEYGNEYERALIMPNPDGAVREGEGRVYASYALSKNPLVIDGGGAARDAVPFEGKKYSTDQLVWTARDRGYDGLIIRNIREGGDGILPVADDYIVFSQKQVKGIDNTVPTKEGTWLDNTGYSRQPTTPDYGMRLIEIKNPFVGDTYSSLIAMAAVKNGERLPNLGSEEEILSKILNNYYDAVYSATDGKTISFADAQKLKVQAGYALDMFEQDYVLPRYKQFLTPQERSEIMGLKYGLAVATSSDQLATIKNYNEALLNRYKTATRHIISQSDLFLSGLGDIDVQKEVEKRQQQLMEQGATLREVDGQVVVVDTREELFNQLQNIPNNILGLENIKALGRNGINQLSNEEAYFLLNVVELAKNMENKTNLIIHTIYKVCPQLARIDFFNTYKLDGKIPKALKNNLLDKSANLSKYNNTMTFDTNMKETIMQKIKESFARDGELTAEKLDKIIGDSFLENERDLGNAIKGSDLKKFKKEAILIYTSAFQPYTYLKDVPKEVKTSIGKVISEQQKGIRQALAAIGDTNKLVDVMENIMIYSADGTVKSFKQVLDGEPDDINKILFNSDVAIIKGADELAMTPITSDMSNHAVTVAKRENEKIATGIRNNYEEGLASYLNKSEMVSQAERDLLNTTLVAARELAKRYTSTKMISDTDFALASINEEIIRRFKSDLLGLSGKFSKGGQWWDIGNRIQDGIMDKWKRVQDRYASYYSMTDTQLGQIRPSSSIDTLALYLAVYFKEIERRLGSFDGLTGVTTNDRINRAFGHLGQVVMNIKTINGLYSLMSGVEGNQILKFFRFSNPKQLSYVKEFVIGGEGKETLFGGYRTYVDRLDEGLNKDWFNKTFATNFTDTEYNKIIQALTGFTIINKSLKWLEGALNFANSSNYLFRTLMSYPGQLVTIANQSIAYFLKQIGWEEQMGIEDLGTVDEIRKKTGILNGTYNEINWFNGYSPDDTDPTTFYNRYGVPDVEDVYKRKKFYSTDDIETIYAKIDEYGASENWLDKINDWGTKFLRNTDAYKDNANNIIDGIFARNFKNIAFVRALQTNSVMRFGTAEQFATFMASKAPESFKRKLMSELTTSSGRHFRNMLGLGFTGLDRAVSGGLSVYGHTIFPAWASNILVGLTQLFNFRGAWGQNIARQTRNFFNTALKMAGMGFSKEGRDAIALYLARQPEFTNFAIQLFNDLKNSWKLIRFQDNGRIPTGDNEYDWLDFISYAADNMQFASQWRQGIQSYGPTRILTDTFDSALKSYTQPDIYKDTAPVGAFFNSLSKNFGRNWKVPAFVVKAIAQGVNNGEDAFWAYLQNEWWKISFGTLRYLMNEDYTSYGYSTEMPRRRVGIPYVLTGEPDEGDKAYSYDLKNTETHENILNWYQASKAGDSEAASIYAMNLWDTAFNSSQLLGTVKGIGQIINGSSLVGSTIKGWMDDMHFYKPTNPFSLAEGGDIIGETEAGDAIMRYGYYIPEEVHDIKTFIDTIIGQSDFRPGNEGFNKSFFNFENSGHMKNLEESNEKDLPMEMLLNNIKYLRDDNREFVLDEKGNRIVTSYWENHIDEIERRINDADYLVRSNFNFIYNWVEANNSDPNYMLYKKLIGEGLAGNFLEQKANQHIAGFNDAYLLKNTKKLNLTELKEKPYYDSFITSLKTETTIVKGQPVPFLEALATLDSEALMEADIKIVEQQLAKTGNQEQIKKFFNIDKKGNVSLGTKYKSFLEEQGRLSSYLRDGDLDSFLAETASITKVFKKDDPYGLMTTTLLGSRVNMINSSDYLSAEQKAKLINVLFKDNADFIQQHIPDVISELGDKAVAEAYITQMNDSLYGSNIITDKLIIDNEMDNSSSGRGNAKEASDTIKAIIVDLAKAAGDSPIIGTKKYDYNFTPVKLEGTKLLEIVGGKGYTPRTPTDAVYKYTPHSKFTIKKDVNRLVNGPKTQSVTKKKLLSKLESDALKAFSAES